MNLVLVRKAVKEPWFPFTLNTTFKKSSMGELPGILVKIGNKLHIDQDAWMEFCEKEQKRQAKIAKEKQSAKTLKREGGLLT
jgi:hypothetical protein